MFEQEDQMDYLLTCDNITDSIRMKLFRKNNHERGPCGCGDKHNKIGAE
jgi:hypothetical protein